MPTPVRGVVPQPPPHPSSAHAQPHMHVAPQHRASAAAAAAAVSHCLARQRRGGRRRSAVSPHPHPLWLSGRRDHGTAVPHTVPSLPTQLPLPAALMHPAVPPAAGSPARAVRRAGVCPVRRTRVAPAAAWPHPLHPAAAQGGGNAGYSALPAFAYHAQRTSCPAAPSPPPCPRLSLSPLAPQRTGFPLAVPYPQPEAPPLAAAGAGATDARAPRPHWAWSAHCGGWVVPLRHGRVLLWDIACDDAGSSGRGATAGHRSSTPGWSVVEHIVSHGLTDGQTVLDPSTVRGHAYAHAASPQRADPFSVVVRMGAKGSVTLSLPAWARVPLAARARVRLAALWQRRLRRGGARGSPAAAWVPGDLLQCVAQWAADPAADALLAEYSEGFGSPLVIPRTFLARRPPPAAPSPRRAVRHAAPDVTGDGWAGLLGAGLRHFSDGSSPPADAADAENWGFQMVEWADDEAPEAGDVAAGLHSP